MPVANYGTAALAQMANARQKFTNEEFAKAQKEKREAEKEAEKQKEMATRSAWGMAGSGMAIGALAMGGPAGMAIGAAGGLGVGILGEVGTRTGQGESFGEALGHTIGRLPTANEVSQIATGAMGGMVTNKLLAGKQALAQQAAANQTTTTNPMASNPAAHLKQAQMGVAPLKARMYSPDEMNSLSDAYGGY